MSAPSHPSRRAPVRSGGEMDEGGRKGRRGDGRVHGCVGAGGDEGVGRDASAHRPRVSSHEELGDDRRRDDGEGRRRVVWRRGVQDGRDRLLEGACARRKHYCRDHDGGEVLHAAVAKGMPSVGRTGGKSRPDDGDERGQGVREVVHRVERDRDGAREGAHDRFEGREHDVAGDGQLARANDGPVPLALVPFQERPQLLAPLRVDLLP